MPNSEKRKQQKREYHARHRDEINARHRERYANDPEYRARRLASCAAYKAKNPEKARAAVRAWHERHRDTRAEYMAEWRERNREHVRTMARQDRRRRRGAMRDDALGYAEVLAGDPCAYCGGPATEVDHIDPLVETEDGDWTNLTAACRSCNARKNRRSLLTYLREVATA